MVTYLWGVYVMWSEKKLHLMVQNCYFELWYHEKLWIPNFFYLDSLSYWYQKLLMFKGYKKIKKNIRIVKLVSFVLQFHPLQHVTGFLRSHHIWLYCILNPVLYMYIQGSRYILFHKYAKYSMKGAYISVSTWWLWLYNGTSG